MDEQTEREMDEFERIIADLEPEDDEIEMLWDIELPYRGRHRGQG